MISLVTKKAVFGKWRMTIIFRKTLKPTSGTEYFLRNVCGQVNKPPTPAAKSLCSFKPSICTVFTFRVFKYVKKSQFLKTFAFFWVKF